MGGFGRRALGGSIKGDRVVGSVVYEALVLGGLSEEEELIDWVLSREEAVVFGEVGGEVYGAGDELSGSGDVGKEAVESGDVGGEVKGVEDEVSGAGKE